MRSDTFLKIGDIKGESLVAIEYKPQKADGSLDAGIHFNATSRRKRRMSRVAVDRHRRWT